MVDRVKAKDRKDAGKAASQKRADTYVRVQQRDRGRCRVCDRVAWLQQHHLVFRSLLGKDESENLISLCAECHADVHGGRLKLAGNADQVDADGVLSGVEVLRQVDGEWVPVRTC